LEENTDEQNASFSYRQEKTRIRTPLAGVAKETFSYACALNKGLSIPKAAKRKKEWFRLDRRIRTRQRPDIKSDPILWGGRAGIKSDAAADHGRRAAPPAELSAERRRAWRGPCP